MVNTKAVHGRSSTVDKPSLAVNMLTLSLRGLVSWLSTCSCILILVCTKFGFVEMGNEKDLRYVENFCFIFHSGLMW